MTTLNPEQEKLVDTALSVVLSKIEDEKVGDMEIEFIALASPHTTFYTAKSHIRCPHCGKRKTGGEYVDEVSKAKAMDASFKDVKNWVKDLIQSSSLDNKRLKELVLFSEVYIDDMRTMLLDRRKGSR